MAAENKPVTTTPTLEEEAARLNTEITRYEDGVVPLYLELGSILVRISESQVRLERTAGLRRRHAESAAVSLHRALHIYRLRKDDPSKCKGMTLFEALDQEHGAKPDPQPVGLA